MTYIIASLETNTKKYLKVLAVCPKRENVVKQVNMDAHNILAVEPNPNIEDFGPGDNVRVDVKVVEGERVRTQGFEGVVLRRRGSGQGETFTVRRISNQIGVERIFLLCSPNVQSVKVLRAGRVRRSRLYYLRGRSGRAARIKEARR